MSIVMFALYLEYVTPGMEGVLFRTDSNLVVRFTPFNVIRLMVAPLQQPKMWWNPSTFHTLYDINYFATWGPAACLIGMALS